jgi:hypothetical protein
MLIIMRAVRGGMPFLLLPPPLRALRRLDLARLGLRDLCLRAILVRWFNNEPCNLFMPINVYDDVCVF